ncbi:MAG: branched-chain amino acid ABC transporter permease [Bradyrhizobium sp.]
MTSRPRIGSPRSTVLLTLLIAASLIVAPFVLSGQYIAALVLAAIYTVITAGLNLFMGYTGQISFGHNAFAALGGYGSAILAMRLDLTPVLTTAMAAAGAAAIALVIGYPTLRLRGHYLAMATLALGLMAFEVASQWKSMTQGLFGISAIPPLGIGAWELASDTSFYVAYWIVAGIAIWVTHRLYHSRTGFALRSIAGNEEAAQSLGIDVARYKLLAFVVSAVFASVGGSMFAHYVTYISPEVFGLYMMILLFTMLFVGGINTTFGPLIGAIVITLFPELLRRFNSARELLYGVVLLVILLFAPRGIYGLIAAFERWRRARGSADAALPDARS